jgi:EmrB/QacA subfamily drug resistance transporter
MTTWRAAVGHTPRGEETAARRHLVLAVLCAGMFMAMLDNVVLSNALPRLGQGLGVGLAGLQWITEAYSLAYAALLLPTGLLGDRYGRRRFYLGGLAVFTIGSMCCALSGTVAQLIAARAVQGAGAAALIPQSLAILRGTYPGTAEQARAFTIWSGISALGLALGPAIGGPLVDAFGWPSAFWINVPIGMATLVVGWIAITAAPGSADAGQRPATGPRSSFAAQSAAAIGMGAAVYALIEGPAGRWTAPPALACGTVAIVSGVLIGARGDWRDALISPALRRDRVVGSALAAAFTVTFAMFGTIAFLGLFMQDVLGWTPFGAAVVGLPSTALIIVVSPVASRMALRYGPRIPLVSGLLSCASALFLLSFFGAGAHYFQYFPALPLMGIGMGLTYTPVTIVMMTRVPIERAGQASSATNLSREVGGVAGIAVLSSLISARTRSVISAGLASAGYPPGAAGKIVAAITGGRFLGSAAAPVQVTTLAVNAFVDGLHLALWVAAAFLLGCAIMVSRLVR